ncbi:MAG: transposase [Symploca sp. SIO1B1]|nr:transposase [Symploca sp. SIO1B1]
MEKDKKYRYRRSIRLKGYDYSQLGAYFITICTNNRECLFGKIDNQQMEVNELGEIVIDVWLYLPTRYPNLELDEFVIMPNHVHCILVITEATEQLPQRELSQPKQRRKMLLPKVVGYFKMNSAKAVNQHRLSSGRSLWQPNYYERIIRNEAELDRVRRYIVNNPAKWNQDCDNLSGNPDQEEIQFWQDFGRKDLQGNS